MKKRRTFGSSRKVKGFHASYSELGSGTIDRRTHKTVDFDRDRLEMQHRREAVLRGGWFGQYLLLKGCLNV